MIGATTFGGSGVGGSGTEPPEIIPSGLLHTTPVEIKSDEQASRVSVQTEATTE